MNYPIMRPRRLLLLAIGALVGVLAGLAGAQAGAIGPAAGVSAPRTDTVTPIAKAGYYGHRRYRVRRHRVVRRVCHRHRRVIRVWNRRHHRWVRRVVLGPRHCHLRRVWVY